MFGNRLGWAISVIIVLIAGYLMLLIYQAGLATPPTGWVQRVVKPFSVQGDVTAVVPGMTKPGDSADFYRTAMADAKDNPDAYTALSKIDNMAPVAVAARPGLKALLAATDLTGMDLFKSNPQEVVNYDDDKPPLQQLQAVADGATRIALVAGTRDSATAEKYYAAVFSLGVKLARERVDFAEFSMGEELMGTGAAGLQSLASRAKRDDRLYTIRNFDSQRLTDYKLKIAPVWKVVSSIDDASIAQHAGDEFQLAQDHNADVMWRVEATLKLGRIRFNANRRGDQVNAMRVLKKMAADDKEPAAVQTAAAAGRDLTIAQYRLLR